LQDRGYTIAETTRAMAMVLRDLRLSGPAVEVGTARWSEYLRAEGLPPDFLRTADHAALHVLAARIDGDLVAAALAYDHAGDCGIYNVGTAQRYRRRGLASAVTLAQLHGAVARGCQTASLQSTPMAERL
jgi:hypothetical protein